MYVGGCEVWRSRFERWGRLPDIMHDVIIYKYNYAVDPFVMRR